MNQAFGSIGRILVAPWQHRRAQGGIWILAVLVALCMAVVLTLSVAAGAKGHLLVAVGLGALVSLCLLLLGAWVMLVGSVLQQNHPTFARLLPGSVTRLRSALLLAWALAIAVAALGLGGVLRAPLAWATGAAILLTLLAALVRWPALGLLGCLAPFFTSGGVPRAWIVPNLQLGLQAGQAAAPEICAATIVACAALLVGLVQRGGPGHVRSYAARKNRSLILESFATGRQPKAVASGTSGWLTRVTAWPYTWWMQRLLARPERGLMARVLLALGPGTHWATRLGEIFWILIIGIVLTAALALSSLSVKLPGLLAILSAAAMYVFVERTLQAQARLHHTRREQVLLMLLPGVPRRGALNRWLSGHLTMQFAVGWAAAIAAAALLGVVADGLRPGIVDESIGQGRVLLAVAMIPLAAFLWRRWARMGAPTVLSAFAPGLAGIALAAMAFVLDWATGCGYPTIGIAYAATTLAWCALRWRRMAGEPSAFPIGRLQS